jgi:hypothetical protein
VKSANEIEEEMLAKMPKFKARPLPKKVQILNTSLSVQVHLELSCAC